MSIIDDIKVKANIDEQKNYDDLQSYKDILLERLSEVEGKLSESQARLAAMATGFKSAIEAANAKAEIS